MIECDKRWRASAGNNVTERKHDTVVHTVGGQQDHQVRRCHQRVADHDFGTDQTPCHPRQPDPHRVDPDHCGQTQMDLAAGPWHTHTHTRLMALCPGLPGWAGTRMVKPIWLLLKQETVSGSGISWAICILLQTDNHASTQPLNFFTGWMPFLPPNQQRQSTEGSGSLKTSKI